MIQTTKTVTETQTLAAQLAAEYPNHKLWLLYGNLGAGKTTMIKGLASALGLPENQVKSPTFIFLADYGPLVHCDLYRLDKPEVDPMTLDMLSEYLDHGKHLVIEWPEKVEAIFSAVPHLKIQLDHLSDSERTISVQSFPASAN